MNKPYNIRILKKLDDMTPHITFKVKYREPTYQNACISKYLHSYIYLHHMTLSYSPITVSKLVSSGIIGAWEIQLMRPVWSTQSHWSGETVPLTWRRFLANVHKHDRIHEKEAILYVLWGIENCTMYQPNMHFVGKPIVGCVSTNNLDLHTYSPTALPAVSLSLRIRPSSNHVQTRQFFTSKRPVTPCEVLFILFRDDIACDACSCDVLSKWMTLVGLHDHLLQFHHFLEIAFSRVK